jgi:hypothetical protein
MSGWRVSAGTTIGASRPRAGGWTSPNQAFWSGASPSGRTYTTTPAEYPV